MATRARPRALADDPALVASLAAGGLLLLAVAVRLWLSRRFAAPWIMVDELIYAELAKTFSESGGFAIRGEPTALYSLLYPVLLAPAWLADSMTTTYALAKAINVAVMSLVAVPVFLWARRLVSPAFAVLALALVLLMPAFVYTGTLMTENAFFPAVLFSLFAIALAVERPALGFQALALATIGLAAAVRLQGVVLVAVYAGAVAVKAVLDRRAGVPARAGRHWPAAAALGALAAGFLALKLAQGAPLRTGLGAYQAASEVDYSPAEAARWILYHLAEIGLSVGFLPLAALVVLLGLALRPGGSPSPAERAFLAVAASGVAWLVAQVGLFASENSLRVQERAMFGAAPLLLLALVVWLDRGLPRPRALTAGAAVLVVGLAAVLPLERLLNITALSDTFGLVPFFRLDGSLPGEIGVVQAAIVAGTALAALAFAALPRKLGTPAFAGGVAFFLLLSSIVVFLTVQDQSLRVRYAQGADDDVSWIDRRLGPDANVVYLYTARLGPVSLWQTEFWNRSVRAIYNVGESEPGSLPQTTVFVDYTTRELREYETKEPVRADAVVADSTITFTAGPLHRFASGLAVHVVDGDPRVKELFAGLSPDGWSGPELGYTLLGCHGGLLHFDLESDGKLFSEPQRLVFEEFGRPVARAEIAPGERATFDVPVRSEEARCVVELSVSPSAVPADVIPDSDDGRELGVIVRGVAHTPAEG